MHYSIDETDDESEEYENDELDNNMIIHINKLAGIPISFDIYQDEYCIAEAVLKDIGERLSLLTKIDNSLIDKKIHKKILKKELNKYLLYLNATQLKTFMENNRTLLTRVEQMFKLL